MIDDLPAEIAVTMEIAGGKAAAVTEAAETCGLGAEAHTAVRTPAIKITANIAALRFTPETTTEDGLATDMATVTTTTDTTTMTTMTPVIA